MNEPEFYCLGSSSSGNSYVFKIGDSQILVEAGFPYKDLVKRLTSQQLKLSDCGACLITHCHGDHAVGASEVSARGIDIYASAPTLEAIKLKLPDRNKFKNLEPKYVTPDVLVFPFLVEHDAPEPMGFIIRETKTETNLLFINDCHSITADLSNFEFDYVFIECNYVDKYVHIEHNNALKEGNKPLVDRYERVMNVHMGLCGCKKLLKTLNLKNCKAIFLMHLSDRNSRVGEMRMKIKNEFPNIPVLVCKKNGGFE